MCFSATEEETKLPGNTTSSHESSDGSKSETTSEPSQHLQQGDPKSIDLDQFSRPNFR